MLKLYFANKLKQADETVEIREAHNWRIVQFDSHLR